MSSVVWPWLDWQTYHSAVLWESRACPQQQCLYRAPEPVLNVRAECDAAPALWTAAPARAGSNHCTLLCAKYGVAAAVRAPLTFSLCAWQDSLTHSLNVVFHKEEGNLELEAVFVRRGLVTGQLCSTARNVTLVTLQHYKSNISTVGNPWRYRLKLHFTIPEWWEVEGVVSLGLLQGKMSSAARAVGTATVRRVRRSLLPTRC